MFLLARASSFAFVLALGGACACSTSSSAPGSCLRTHENACVEYGAAQAAAGKRLCAGSTWSEGAGTCPAAGRVGTCTREGETRILLGGAPNNYDAASARTACEAAAGKFSAL